MIIKIKNLRLRTIIGIFDWEKEIKQDVLINAEIEIKNESSTQTDKIEETLDYKKLKKDIILEVESREFNLIEKLADVVLSRILDDARVSYAKVEVDKPGALRHADSVSVTLERWKKETL